LCYNMQMNKSLFLRLGIFASVFLVGWSFYLPVFANTIDNVKTTDVSSIDQSSADLVTTEYFPEIINSFRSDIVVNTDSTVSVTETIQYDFKDNEKHGIYRTIPLTDVVGSFDTLKISNIKVTDDKGTPYIFDKNNSNLFGGGEVNIKIGDPDKTISGIHTYVITYDLKNALGYFDDRTEIYWNVTGNEWQVPIWHAETYITLPGDIPESSLHLASYCGASGSKDICSNPLVKYNNLNNTTEIYFSTNSEIYLDAQEGMTIATAFPKQTVVYPTGCAVVV